MREKSILLWNNFLSHYVDVRLKPPRMVSTDRVVESLPQLISLTGADYSTCAAACYLPLVVTDTNEKPWSW